MEQRRRRRRDENQETQKPAKLLQAWHWLRTHLLDDGPTEDAALDDRPFFPRARAWLARRWDAQHAHRTKLILSTCLWLLALLVKVLTGGSVTSVMLAGNTMAWLAVAMLIEYEPVRRWVRQYFLWGLAFFALFLGLTVAALMLLYHHTETHVLWLLLMSLSLFVLLTLLVVINYLRSSHRQPLLLRLGFVLNALLLCGLGALSLTLCIATTGRGWVMLLGVVMIYIASVLFATTTYSSQRRSKIIPLIWGLYAPGQALLLIGVGLISMGV